VSRKKFTVALIGPDGAGKTTISRRLVAESRTPLTAIYMGVNADSSGLMLPTTRLLLAIKQAGGSRPDPGPVTEPDRRHPRPRGPVRRAAGACKSAARLTVWLSEEWFRQLVAWWYSTVRGRVVLFDRHFFVDYYDYDVTARHGSLPLSRRIHGFVLRHLYPKPDLVIYLDAPAEVLFARKGEASVEWLARRREEYLRMREVVPHFAAVDASAPPEQVTTDVAEAISSFECLKARSA
jgi:thymidylate kinase